MQEAAVSESSKELASLHSVVDAERRIAANAVGEASCLRGSLAVAIDSMSKERDVANERVYHHPV
jgi:hypothetical protein